MSKLTDETLLTTTFALHPSAGGEQTDNVLLIAALRLCTNHEWIGVDDRGSHCFSVTAKRKYYLAVDKLLEDSSVIRYVLGWKETR